MSNWKSRDIKRAADAVRKAMTARKHSDFLLSTALSKLGSSLDDGEFRKFCMDTEDGLGVAANTALKYERMVSALTVLPTEAVWDRVGWEGVIKIVKISARNERISVSRAVVREQSVTVGKQRLADIMAEKAPSYTEVRGRGRGGASGRSRTRAVRERDLLVTTLSKLLEEYSVLRSQVPEEVMLLLEERRAQAG